jgi:hypothetical protein
MVSYTESQWISVKYSECFLIALFFCRAPVRSIQITIQVVLIGSSSPGQINPNYYTSGVDWEFEPRSDQSKLLYKWC